MQQGDGFGAREAAHSIPHGREWPVAADATPPVAAHLVTSRIGYTHHGIHVGDGKVVHYPGLFRGWRAGPVEEVSLAEFARGRPVRVRPHVSARFGREDVVARARSRLGEDCYRILSNNCEHFCEWCVHGENRSRQIDEWRMRPLRVLLAALSFLGRPARRTSPVGSTVPW